MAGIVEWILLYAHNVSDLLNYLEASITAGQLNSNKGAENLVTSVAVCKSLGRPDKCIGPTFHAPGGFGHWVRLNGPGGSPSRGQALCSTVA